MCALFMYLDVVYARHELAAYAYMNFPLMDVARTFPCTHESDVVVVATTRPPFTDKGNTQTPKRAAAASAI